MSELSRLRESEGYGACSDDLEGKELPGAACACQTPNLFGVDRAKDMTLLCTFSAFIFREGLTKGRVFCIK